MKSKNTKERLFEVMQRLDKTFKPTLNENIFNTPQMGGITNSKGVAGYNPDTSKQDAEYAASVRKNNPDDTAEGYFPITTPIGSQDDKMFVDVVNKGIDSHLEGFTKSKFTVQGNRRVFNFHKSELPILLRRLEELGTDEALQWKDDIQNYDSNIDEIANTLAADKKIATTYQTVTPESAEQGDYADQGWEDEEGESMTPDEYDAEDGITAVDKAVRFLQDKGGNEPSSSQFHEGVWYSTVDPERDFHTGEEKYYSFHLKGFTPEEEAQIFEKINLRR